jgi:hypothetical protein
VPRWAIAVAVIVALVPATYLTAHRAFHDTSATPRDHSTDLPIPPVSPAVPPSATPSDSLTTGPPSPTPKHLPAVPPDAPRRITSGDLLDAGFDSAGASLQTSSASEVTRWESRGSPGSPGTDTVYVTGRILTGSASAFAALPRLATGDTVAIRTDSGTMTYTVKASTEKAEAGLADDPLFTARTPGLLVLVGIRYDAPGERTGRAVVVTAELSAARPA